MRVLRVMPFRFIALLFLLIGYIQCKKEAINDDFADFEDFDDGDAVVSILNENSDAAQIKNSENSLPTPADHQYRNDDDDSIDADSEFDHFTDEEEFEGFDKDTPSIPILDQKTGEPKLTVAKVPLHFGTQWKSYWMEMIMIAGLLAYFANYLLGRSKNSKLASLWLKTHRSLLEENFAVIGDDNNKEREGPDGLIKESENIYTIWCTGRTCCEGMLVELKLIRRQDLVAIIGDLMKPTQDQLHIKIELSSDVMDSFVFCVATKRTASKFFKEMYDLSKYCSQVSSPESKFNVPTGFSVLSEINEASAAMLDSRVTTILSKYSNLIDYIYVSDQYNGIITQEDTSSQCLKMPDVKKQLLLGFNLPKNNDMESAKPLLMLVFYLLEKIKRYRLSKEGKTKADKNRQRVEDEFMKSTHVVRAEAAAIRREEKRKLEKERVMAEEDPEKQRRWEKKELKRQQKKGPKMKQLSVKAL